MKHWCFFVIPTIRGYRLHPGNNGASSYLGSHVLKVLRLEVLEVLGASGRAVG